jgi:hypothetical protein
LVPSPKPPRQAVVMAQVQRQVIPDMLASSKS